MALGQPLYGYSKFDLYLEFAHLALPSLTLEVSEAFEVAAARLRLATGSRHHAVNDFPRPLYKFRLVSE